MAPDEELTDRVQQRLEEKIDEYRKKHLELEMLEEQIMVLADNLEES